MSTTAIATTTILPKQLSTSAMMNHKILIPNNQKKAAVVVGQPQKPEMASTKRPNASITSNGMVVGAGAVSNMATFNAYNQQQNSNFVKPKRKRQRLDHLTQEEKVMRRKLKNRMAAQSARDRKKMKMMDLESENERLTKERVVLLKRNSYFEQKIKLLEQENESLRKRLGIEPIKLENKMDQFVEDDDAEGAVLNMIYNDNLNGNSSHSFDEDLTMDGDVDDDDEEDDGMASGSDDSSPPTSDYYSSGSPIAQRVANAFESAELINVPLPKEQVLKTCMANKRNKEERDRSVPELSDSSDDASPVSKVNNHQRYQSTKKQNPMTCSLQQLTSFLMVLLGTITMDNSNNNSQSSLIMTPVISFILKQLGQMQLNNNKLDDNNNSQLSKLMDLEFSQCLSQFVQQSQLNSLIQQFQKRNKVRLRM